MRKHLLNSIAVLTLTLGSTAVAMADNVVYGLISSWDGTTTTSFDIDKVNTSAPTTVEEGFPVSNATEVKCAVTAGDKYYAFITTIDPESYADNVELATVNFTTGNVVTVNDFSYKYGKPGYSAIDMTYDEKSNVIYSIETDFDDDNKYVTVLYTVDPENGSMTKITNWQGQFQAIASDHNGGFYLVKYVNGENYSVYPHLYKATIDGQVSEYIANTTVTPGYTSNNSLVVSEDGKHAYFIAGTHVLDYTLDTKSVTMKGDLSNIVAGVSYGKSSADGTHNDAPAESKKNTRFLVETITYGSSMGDISTDIDSSHDYYYYNSDGKMVGSYSEARDYGEYGGVTETFNPTGITKVKFDENGNVTNKDSYQWGMYDFDDYTWKKTYNSESYTYDESGVLIADTTSTAINTYEYNADGTLAKKTVYNKYSKTVSQTFTYTSYDENGNAWHISSTGAWDSYNYEADCEYDEDGNKTMEFRYKMVDDPDFPGETKNVSTQYETWVYNDGILRTYAKSLFDEEGNEIPYTKTDYEPVDGNINEIAVKDYTYSDGKWYDGDLPKHLIYADYSNMSDMKEMLTMESAVELVKDEKNTVAVEFSIPELAYSQTCNVVIYRDCMPIDTVNIYDAYDEEYGCCVYKDKGLKNGTYTYFVQPMFSSYTEGPLDLDDDMGVGDDDAEWTAYFATTPMDIKVYTELPTVTGLKLAGGKVETTGSIINMRKTYYADLEWKNPENAEDYGFIKNSIYFEGAGVAEKDTADIAANKATVMLYDEDAMVYIVTSYTLGKAISESIPVKLKDIESTLKIEDVTVSGAKIAFNGRTISLSDNANVSVYSANGNEVLSGKNTNSVSLDNMPIGTYIICVEKNGKVNAYKYSVK